MATAKESLDCLNKICSIEDLIIQAETLLKTCDQELAHVSDILKLRRKIKAELVFLQKYQSIHGSSSILKCSNLPQLAGVVDCLICSGPPATTLRTFKSSPSNLSLVIDIVCHGGLVWKKIIARNPDALMREWKGECEFNRRTLMMQLDDYLTLAKLHPVNFKTPKVVFVFMYGVNDEIKLFLEEKGILVVEADTDTRVNTDLSKNLDTCNSSNIDFVTKTLRERFSAILETRSDGDIKANDSAVCRDTDNESDLSEPIISVNLDITAAIALISQLCHGGCHYKFVEPVLTEQAETERQRPVLPALISYLKGKTLHICRTAHRELIKIVETIGGVNERRRLDELLSRVRIVDDFMSERTQRMAKMGRVKERSKLIFGTGDALKAVTVTANSGFVRAARCQGVEFAVFLHEARALSEQKEITAVPL